MHVYDLTLGGFLISQQVFQKLSLPPPIHEALLQFVHDT